MFKVNNQDTTETTSGGIVLVSLLVTLKRYLSLARGPGVFPSGNHMFKVSNRNTRARCEICLKLTIKTLERRQWCRSGVFIVNFKHISHLVLVFLLLTSSK